MNGTIDTILNNALREKEMTASDLAFLLKTDEAQDRIIQTADRLNRRANGDFVSFVHNRNINYTNICRNHCLFCGFRRGKEHPESYLLEKTRILASIEVTPGLKEICIQGGLNPRAGLQYAVQLLEAVKSSFPDLHIHAFSPMEMEFFAQESGLSIDRVIRRLMEAGLDSMPGTAAEILDDEVRSLICPEKICSERWVEIVTTAHSLGLRSTATIMLGHIESTSHIAYHLECLRRIQKNTGGFTEFIPLFFIPDRTRLAARYRIEKRVSLEWVRRFFALSRIFFNGFIENIQASWPKLGFKGAARCLSAGVNDLGGTLYQENITRSAGGAYGEFVSPGDFTNTIKKWGKIPRERDTLYQSFISV
jgi:7,8-didemethyl-8-hydroxy-5-deazariboflavin synthase CofH subunit